MKDPVAQNGRLERIRAFVEQEQQVTVGQVAAHFHLSAATVRRAIGTLADRGEISRFRGGALAIPRSPRELPVLQREQDQRDAKRRIGRAAAALVGDGETIFLGSGTTTLEVARNLTDQRDLTVLTNSLLVIRELIPATDISVIALGGMLRRSEYSFIGHLVEQALQEMRVTKVIMGIRAIHAELGLMNDYLPETLTDRSILHMGGEVVIVADHTKCDRVAPAYVAPVSAIGTLVTDTDAPDGFVAALEGKQVNVHRV
jgi:DeoR family transcriptional regulator of aga operon/DeoR family fructose operon transcriptional repressor